MAGISACKGCAGLPNPVAAFRRYGAGRWSNLNYLRYVIVLVAWISALKAFSLLYQQRQSM
jgi:hypothetical protein